ncbi:MAG: DNA-directed RNA polymerase subunit omega [Deltaproteobacteria bacterium]|nr:DNA-directed RNA polymerase subunit omega [Deltaproteobacteria bacterium]
MARITVEDCLNKVNNRFVLIHMASKRVRQLRKGAEPTVSAKNKDIVISLREIAAGNIRAIKGTGIDKSQEYQDTFFTEDLLPTTNNND